MATPGTAKRQQSELLASTASSGRPRREASKGVERLLDRLHGGHEAAFDVPGGPEATARSMSEVTHNGQAARPRGRAKAQSRSRRSNSAAQDFADLEGAPDDAGEAGPADEPGESDLVTNLRIQLRPELQRLQDIAGAVNTTPNSVVKAAKEDMDHIVSELMGTISMQIDAKPKDHTLLLGASGVGKTALLKALLTKYQQEPFNRDRIAVTAYRKDSVHQFSTSTEKPGTIFSYAGFTPSAVQIFDEHILRGDHRFVFFDFGSRGSASMRASHGSWISGDDASALFQMLKDKGEGVLTRAHHKFSHRVLVVDDVFCFSPSAFAVADIVLRGRRRNFEQPFGGLVLIAAGDPLKGRPSSESQWVTDEHSATHHLNRLELSCSPAFLSLFAWFNLYTLSFNFRLKDDNKFSKCLDKLRLGIITDDLCDIMKERSDKVVPEDAIHLFFSATDKERYIYRHCIDDGPLTLDRAHGPFELFFETTDDYPVDAYVPSHSTSVIKKGTICCIGATVRLCMSLPDKKLEVDMTFKVVGFTAVDPRATRVVAKHVEVEGPLQLPAEEHQRYTVEAMDFVDNHLEYSHTNDQYSQKTYGGVRGIPLATVDAARAGPVYTVASVHTRVMLQPIVIHFSSCTAPGCSGEQLGITSRYPHAP